MPIEYSGADIARYYAVRIPSLLQKGKEWRGPCPVHGGERDSFSVDSATGMAFCHSQCDRGWDIIALEQELGSKDFIGAKTDVYAILNRPMEEKTKRRKEWGPIDAVYDYTDAEGVLLYQVVRHKNPKDFRQRRPSGIPGEFINGLGDVEWVPYHLPEVISATKTVFVVEGEKDADAIRSLGLVATCNNGGAESFKPELAKWFSGKRVAIIPDNDEAGRKHAAKVAEILYAAAKSIKILELPGLLEKGDSSDFIANGGTVDHLREIYSAAKLYDPKSAVSDEDKYVRTFRQELEIAGGLGPFWDMSLRDGIPTPWPKLTRALGGGLLNGEVYAIGANTGQGKTSLGLQFAIAALRDGRGVLIYSLEMDWRSVMRRMVAIEARVDLNAFRDAQLSGLITTTEMRQALTRFTSEFVDLPFAVSRKSKVSPKYVVEESRRLKGKLPKLDLIIVDHLQLMSPDERKISEYEKFTSISRALKQSAVELDVPVLVMSQTTRHNAQENRPELDLHDLRGSGAIEEDLAGCIMVYPDRDDLKVAEAQGRLESGPIKFWAKLAKNRYGESPVYSCLNFFKYCTRFDLYDENWRMNSYAA